MIAPDTRRSGEWPIRRLADQPYLLLSLTSLFWAGNVVVARFVIGHVPPVALGAPMVVGPALAAGLVDAEAWRRGVAGLRRAAERDGVFCYTFFKARGERARERRDRSSPIAVQ